MTEKIYFSDPSCVEATAVVVDINEEVSAVVLDRTIFHVKGGGQAADCGTLDGIVVLNVLHGTNGGILHQVTPEDLTKLPINSTITMKLNPEKRKYHSRLHTAGHLLAGIVEKFYPNLEAISGNHIPGQCKVVFAGENFPEKEDLRIKATTELESTIKENLSVSAVVRNELRTISIDGLHNSPCGGTHVSKLGEIGKVTIRKINIKGNQLTIGYDVG